MHQDKNIYITGFMGSGKSTIGKLLAGKLGRTFVDTDRLVEQNTGMKIADIFQNQGEAHFRQLETNALDSLARQNKLVVSLGGGIVIDPQNRKILENGVWIFLNTPFSVLTQRLSRTSHRPLAKDAAKTEALYKTRLPMYQMAQITIDCTGDAEEVCRLILKKLVAL